MLLLTVQKIKNRIPMAGDHLVEVGFPDSRFNISTYLLRNQGERALPEIRLRCRQQSFLERARSASGGHRE
jgi:hypothetical protein